jgi:lysophospholipase L1-like esterase
MKLPLRWTALVACFSVAAQQPAPPLSNADAFALYERAVQLMESTSLVQPELARAGAPIIENARQAVATLRSLNRQHAEVTYTFLGNVRAYLALADAIPKPGTFADETARQFTELRQIFERADANFRTLLRSKEAQLRNPDRNSLARYAPANAKLGPPQPALPRVVFLGDSITDLWRLNEYFPAHDFVNRGISGQVTDEMLARVEADVVAVKPAAMLLLGGTNDIARGVPIDIVENNIQAMAELAQSHGIKLLLASVLPVGESRADHPPQTILALNDWIKNLCRLRNYTYVDYFAAMAGPSGYLRPDLSDDGLHPNSLGYRLMAPVALAAIEKVAPPGPASKHRKGPPSAR